MQKRPPIVVILGSVDHGKTTLLDYIRKTNIADREAGGITQSIGAHEIMHTNSAPSPSGSGDTNAPIRTGEKITFIDTPGHEAFIKMRARGCHFADIGILMVAADDGVKPQTKESIRILKESETPFVVAINKIDTKGANLEKVKNELTAEDVSLEGHGGNISYQEISAKTGDGISDLLDLVVLASDLEELKYDPKGSLDGFILESQIDQRRGTATTAVIKNGTLKVGDEVSAGKANGKVKALTNFLGEKIKSATASTPVEILGFESLPEVGDLLKSGKSEAKDEDVAQKEAPEENGNEGGETINIVLRADLAGSLEAISESIKGMDEELRQAKDDYPGIYIADEAVGEVTDGDIKTAVSTKAIVVGFRTKVSKAAENLARGQDVKIITSEVIYDLTKTIRELLEGMKEMAVTGKLKILGVFGKKDGNQIVGGEVVEGEIKNQTTLDIERNGEIISSGKIINLQKNKKDIQVVPAGNQCGIIIDAKKKIEVGDHLIAH